MRGYWVGEHYENEHVLLAFAFVSLMSKQDTIAGFGRFGSTVPNLRLHLLSARRSHLISASSPPLLHVSAQPFHHL